MGKVHNVANTWKGKRRSSMLWMRENFWSGLGKVAKGALGHGPIGGFHGSRSVFNNLNSPAARRRSRGNYMAELTTEFRKVVKERFDNTSRVSAGEENTHCW